MALLALAALLGLLLWLVWRSILKPNCSPVTKLPCPPRSLVFGHLNRPWKPGPEGYQWHIDMSSQFRRIWVFWLGTIPHVIPTCPEEVAKICKTLTPKSYGYKYLSDWMGSGLLTNNDPTDWKKKRRMLTPAFHFDVLKQYVDIFTKNTLLLVEQWEKCVENGNDVVDVQADMTYLSLDNIGECAFGVAFNAINERDSPFVKATLDASKLLMDRFSNPLFSSDLLYKLSPSGRRNSRALKILHQYSRDAIQRRASELESGKDASRQKYFLDILLTARDENGLPLTDKEMQDEVDTFMFEGHDTTSSGLMWTLYILSLHSDYQEKVFQEVDSVLNGKQVPDYSDLQRMEYLTRVLKESHRFLSPVPGVSRELDVPMEFGGQLLPKGTTIAIQPISVHMNPDVWENPQEFNPDRFRPEQFSKMPPFSYIPFSAGPRNCIGQNFAMTEEKAVLSVLLHKYIFSFAGKSTSVKMHGEMVLRNRGSLFLRVQRR